ASLLRTDRRERGLSVALRLAQPRFFDVDPVTATTTTVKLTGQPHNNEKWSLVVDGRAYTVTVATGGIDTLAELAAEFALRLNADATATQFSAWSKGDVLVVASRAGAAFATASNAQNVTRSAGQAFITLDFGLSAIALRDQLRI